MKTARGIFSKFHIPFQNVTEHTWNKLQTFDHYNLPVVYILSSTNIQYFVIESSANT